jgi:hypothetical protein
MWGNERAKAIESKSEREREKDRTLENLRARESIQQGNVRAKKQRAKKQRVREVESKSARESKGQVIARANKQ